MVFNETMGNAGIVSHQWVAKQHPDPEFKQMKVLQDVLRRLLNGPGRVHVDAVTEAATSAKSIACQDFQSKALFLWYDYFSVPQLETASSLQEQAINSIPAYVVKCRFFFALCPTIDCPSEGKVLSVGTWAQRGWCKAERASRELSANDSWILIKSSAALEVVGTALSLISGPVGEGEFTEDGDRAKLAPVMKAIVKRKLMMSLQARDFPSYRRHLNLQAVHLRGLDAEPVRVLPPNSDPGSEKNEVADFLYETGLTKVDLRDSAGWWPLHYAAMLGKATLIKALLMQRANPNRRTARDEPKLGLPPWLSALDLAIFYKNNDAARLLIAARAELSGGMQPAMVLAASSGNAEGVGLLCEANANPCAGNVLGGVSPFYVAAAYGYGAVLEELVQQTELSTVELSKSLFGAVGLRGGSAELVQQLISLRADVDFQFDTRRHMNTLGRLFHGAKSLQHSLGSSTSLSAIAYHGYGTTPLMGALFSAQYEGAAALIAAGAGWTLRTAEVGLPLILLEAMPSQNGCRKGLRVTPQSVRGWPPSLLRTSPFPACCSPGSGSATTCFCLRKGTDKMEKGPRSGRNLQTACEKVKAQKNCVALTSFARSSHFPEFRSSNGRWGCLERIAHVGLLGGKVMDALEAVCQLAASHGRGAATANNLLCVKHGLLVHVLMGWAGVMGDVLGVNPYFQDPRRVRHYLDGTLCLEGQPTCGQGFSCVLAAGSDALPDVHCRCGETA